MKLKIYPKFQNALPPLSPDEFKNLEQEIRCAGSLNIPIEVWNGKIVDGHNRFFICKKLNITIPDDKIKVLDFADEDEVVSYIRKKQKSQRNLNKISTHYVIGDEYNIRKKKHGGDKKSSGQNDHLKTSEIIAQEFNVGEKTIRRAGIFADDLNNLETNVGVDYKNMILNEQIKSTFDDIHYILEFEPAKQKEILEFSFKKKLPLRLVLRNYRKTEYIDVMPLDRSLLNQIKDIVKKSNPDGDVIEIVVKHKDGKWIPHGRIKGKVEKSMQQQLKSFVEMYNLNGNFEKVIWHFGEDSISTQIESTNKRHSAYIQLNNIFHCFVPDTKIGISETSDLLKLINKMNHDISIELKLMGGFQYLYFVSPGRNSFHRLTDHRKIIEIDFEKPEIKLDLKLKLTDEQRKKIIAAGTGLKDFSFISIPDEKMILLTDSENKKMRTIQIDFDQVINSQPIVLDGKFVLDILQVSKDPVLIDISMNQNAALIEVWRDDVKATYVTRTENNDFDFSKVFNNQIPESSPAHPNIVYRMVDLGLEESEAIDIYMKDWKYVHRNKRVDARTNHGKNFDYYILQKIDLVTKHVNESDKTYLSTYFRNSIEYNWNLEDLLKEIATSKYRSKKSKNSREKNKLIRELDSLQNKYDNVISNVSKSIFEKQSDLVDKYIDKNLMMYDDRRSPLENYNSNFLVRNKCNEELQRDFPETYNTESIVSLKNDIEQINESLRYFEFEGLFDE